MSAPHVAVIGNVNVDMIMGPQEPWPRPGAEVVLPDYELRVGGSAGNAALALQALGVPLRLLANAGDDRLGHWLKESFGEAAEQWPLAPVPTTVSVGITHPNGERTFFTNRGHLDVFAPEDILPWLPSLAAEGSVALLVGPFLSPRIAEAFTDLLASLRSAGYRIALDTGWPPQGWSETARAQLAAWLAQVDMLLANEVEVTGFAQSEDLGPAVASIRSLMPARSVLAVKRGPNGASLWQGEDVTYAPAPPTRVADSIGAGDIFNAGFLAAVLAGAAPSDALRAGVELASRVIATSPRRYGPAA